MAVRHQCMIYKGSPAQHLPGLTTVILERLNSNSRCVYMNSPPMVAGIRSCLAAKGLDVVREVARGALILSSDDGHLLNGRFDVDRMLTLLAESVEQALSEGFQNLWVTGDMTWEFGTEKNFSKLRNYEQGLERLFQTYPALQGVCQYHLDTLPPDAIGDALHTHRACHINETLVRFNPRYQSPRPKKLSHEPGGFLEHMLAHPNGER